MRLGNKIEIRLKKGYKPVSQKFIGSLEEDFDFQAFKKHVRDLKSQQADLNEVFIFPQEKAVYEDIIKIMDGVRQAGIFSMGLSPI